MQASFDSPEFRQALLDVVNAANDAGTDARRYGFDEGTRKRCQNVFNLAKSVSSAIPKSDGIVA